MSATVPPDLSSLKIDLAAPAEAAVVVTPSNSIPLPNGRCRSLFIGTGGDVTVIDFYGNITLHKNLYNGQVLPVRAVYVKNSGTTASNIVAWY